MDKTNNSSRISSSNSTNLYRPSSRDDTDDNDNNLSVISLTMPYKQNQLLFKDSLPEFDPSSMHQKIVPSVIMLSNDGMKLPSYAVGFVTLALLVLGIGSGILVISFPSSPSSKNLLEISRYFAYFYLSIYNCIFFPFLVISVIFSFYDLARTRRLHLLHYYMPLSLAASLIALFFVLLSDRYIHLPLSKSTPSINNNTPPFVISSPSSSCQLTYNSLSGQYYCSSNSTNTELWYMKSKVEHIYDSAAEVPLAHRIWMVSNMAEILFNHKELCLLVLSSLTGIILASSFPNMRHENIEIIQCIQQLQDLCSTAMSILYRFFPLASCFFIIVMINELYQSSQYLYLLNYLAIYLLSSLVYSLVLLPLLPRCLSSSLMFGLRDLIFPVLGYALWTSSSRQTFPYMLSHLEKARSIQKLQKVQSKIISYFNTVLCMAGSSIYLSTSTYFLARINQQSVSIFDYFLIMLFSVTSSIACVPVPTGGLLLCVNIWCCIFNKEPNFDKFLVIAALEFVTDRLRTMLNVGGNFVLLSLILSKEKCEGPTSDDEGFNDQHESMSIQ